MVDVSQNYLVPESWLREMLLRLPFEEAGFKAFIDGKLQWIDFNGKLFRRTISFPVGVSEEVSQFLKEAKRKTVCLVDNNGKVFRYIFSHTKGPKIDRDRNVSFFEMEILRLEGLG